MAKQNTRLELTWIGKENRPKLEPRILLEDAGKSYHAAHRVGENDLFDNRLIFGWGAWRRLRGHGFARHRRRGGPSTWEVSVPLLLSSGPVIQREQTTADPAVARDGTAP